MELGAGGRGGEGVKEVELVGGVGEHSVAWDILWRMWYSLRRGDYHDVVGHDILKNFVQRNGSKFVCRGDFFIVPDTETQTRWRYLKQKRSQYMVKKEISMQYIFNKREVGDFKAGD